MRTPALVATTLLAAALAGCGGGEPGADAPDPSTTAPPTPSTSTPTPSVSEPTGGGDPADVEDDPRVQAALDDARGRAGIVPTEVVVAGYSRVTWNDGSLGCPEEGQSYIQMTVPGELLLLRADQRLMAYHAAEGKAFAYCARPSDGYTVTG